MTEYKATTAANSSAGSSNPRISATMKRAADALHVAKRHHLRRGVDPQVPVRSPQGPLDRNRASPQITNSGA